MLAFRSLSILLCCNNLCISYTNSFIIAVLQYFNSSFAILFLPVPSLLYTFYSSSSTSTILILVCSSVVISSVSGSLWVGSCSEKSLKWAINVSMCFTNTVSLISCLHPHESPHFPLKTVDV